MRWIGFTLCLLPLVAHAAPELQVSVASGSEVPQAFKYAIDGAKYDLDLRDSHRYQAAFKDTATKRDVCREGEYKTGLLLTLRSLPKTGDGAQPVEIIGQVSKLDGVTDGQRFSCGSNQVVKMSNQAFSDTVQVEPNRTKVVVIDGKYTVILKVL
ncbi:hypothetical protein IYR97_25885 (plasmid) [Pseudomonas fulva]|uniref:Uncharacterized protein n=3 Tax=Pseudomonas TaxID=286 RepID=A0AAJ5V4L5_9PSED|nr:MULTISPECIES: hypothetical protein [Pseudomonas]MCT8162814.1 hypothetical protein [Pseudomonas sp. HD6422]MCT8181417.1 hypothetical protein [Pseudomonas sp. HD6421]MDM1712478.1 hypothetical protein [Pseudomonas sp. 165]ORL52128.1 hypothetical protein B7H18_08890 [Pseudomonas putida]ORL65503.1 hypothetical protein B7H19_22360 [Pseudomonas putida]